MSIAVSMHPMACATIVCPWSLLMQPIWKNTRSRACPSTPTCANLELTKRSKEPTMSPFHRSRNLPTKSRPIAVQDIQRGQPVSVQSVSQVPSHCSVRYSVQSSAVNDDFRLFNVSMRILPLSLQFLVVDFPYGRSC